MLSPLQSGGDQLSLFFLFFVLEQHRPPQSLGPPVKYHSALGLLHAQGTSPRPALCLQFQAPVELLQRLLQQPSLHLV